MKKKRVSFNNIVNIKYYNKNEPIEKKNIIDSKYFIYSAITLVIIILISLLL